MSGPFENYWKPYLCRLRSIAANRKHFVRCLSVCPSVCVSVCLSDDHTFLVVTHSYVSQATIAFHVHVFCLRRFNFTIGTHSWRFIFLEKLVSLPDICMECMQHAISVLFSRTNHTCKNKALANKRRFTCCLIHRDEFLKQNMLKRQGSSERVIDINPACIDSGFSVIFPTLKRWKK